MTDTVTNNNLFSVIDQQKDFIVIYKSPGIGFHREENEPGLFDEVVQTLDVGKLYPVHRLDKITSGLILMAKSSESASALGNLFLEKRIEKHYIALSDNKPSKKQGLIKGDMTKARRGAWKLLRSLENPAITQFKSFGTNTGIRVFLIKPSTGKTHQIRVALKSVGAPIIGDSLYGGSQNQEIDRTYLHAFSLHFRYGHQDYSYIAPPKHGRLFQEPEVQKIIETRLTPPWGIDFPKLN
ncbi:MAG: TIGR01621 family pseudouridine synthase [Pseudomonadales bacterium]|nr:TIGR01621 family pseudouridine synthase [Pseudomonadales bacterium]